MADYNVYEDIANRSGGELFIGVVGPMRTGKSTLVKKMMTELVLPHIPNGNARLVMTDGLPQSGSGKTVMTTEPKFVPDQAVTVSLANASAAVRFCDCVGFVTQGVQGVEEDGVPRLVKTPWSASPMPFAEAATLGTEKVINEHAHIALLVTTDGSVTDMPRDAYIEGEERTVQTLRQTGKPFVIVLNTADPNSMESQWLCADLQQKYGCAVRAVNCEEADEGQLLNILRDVLFEFPLTGIDIEIPSWMRVLPPDSSAIAELLACVKEATKNVCKMKDATSLENMTKDCRYWQPTLDVQMSLSTGRATLSVEAKEGVFYALLSETAGKEIGDEKALMRFVAEAAEVERRFSVVKEALDTADVDGYGIVPPLCDKMTAESPRLVKKGNSVGIRLHANAPSYHIIRVDVHGDISPVMGSGTQNERLANDLMQTFEVNPNGMWQADVFGKTLREVVHEGLSAKSVAMQEQTKGRMRRAVTRIVNEGRGGVICLLL